MPFSTLFLLLHQHPPPYGLILRRSGPLALNDHSCASKLMDDISLFPPFLQLFSTWIYKGGKRDQGCHASTFSPSSFQFCMHLSLLNSEREEECACVCPGSEKASESERDGEGGRK